MASFLGHIFPGSVLVLLSVWWTINIFKDFYLSKGRNGQPFRSRPWYPGPFCTNFPLESTLKIVTVILGMTAELMMTFRGGHPEDMIIGAQHTSVYFFFGLNGAMDLLRFYRCQLPEGIEAASGILAIGVEGFLIYNHVPVHNLTNAHVHLLLCITNIACIVSIFLEIQYRTHNYVIPSLSRAFFAQMHGTWLCQVAFVVYPPFAGMQHWNLENHEQKMLVTVMFTWHLAINFVAMLIIGAEVWVYMKTGHMLPEVNYHLMPPTVKKNGINGQLNHENLQLLNSDSEV